MLRKSLTNPAILSVISSDDKYQVVPLRVICVQEIRDNSQESQAPGKND